MRVLGLISSLTDASSRARILQYKDALEREKILLTPRFFRLPNNADPEPWAYRLNKITKINPWRFTHLQKTISRIPLLLQQYNYDIIWQNRLVLPHQSFYEKKFVRPIVFDFDDAIWLHDGEKKVADAISQSAITFAGNEYLADFACKYCGDVFIIPSVIDTEKLFPLQKKDTKFTIGWIGTVTNLRFLELVKPAILDFLSQYEDSRFMVVSSEKTAMFDFDNERIIFKKWSAENENILINEFSIGIMPLTDTDFTRGKCSYKMLQYMACGKPVIVSPVGMNSKLLASATIGLGANTTNEWLSAFTTLKNDRDFYTACAGNGRDLVEKNYSVDIYTPVIRDHFKKLSAK